MSASRPCCLCRRRYAPYFCSDSRPLIRATRTQRCNPYASAQARAASLDARSFSANKIRRFEFQHSSPRQVWKSEVHSMLPTVHKRKFETTSSKEPQVDQEAVHSDGNGPESRDLGLNPSDSDYESQKNARPGPSWHDHSTPEAIAQAAREAFGDVLPEGKLSQEQYDAYVRMYGEPLVREPGYIEDNLDEGDMLYSETPDGSLEEVGVMSREPNSDLMDDSGSLDASEEDSLGTGHTLNAADYQLQDDIQKSLGGRIARASTLRSVDEEDLREDDELQVGEAAEVIDSMASQPPRTHPLTLAARSGTVPSTIPLPRAFFTRPVSELLGAVSNKHLEDAAEQALGGPWLPYSPSAPKRSRTMPQLPVPLVASQHRMTDMEANVYLTAIMPQAYAAIIGALVEARRRLGSHWMEQLLAKDGGPSVLDAGAAGGGVLAWREVIKAEWKRMHDVAMDPSVTAAASDQSYSTELPPAPLGKSTVITGSPALRKHVATLLEDTTFLPRLPDYVHTVTGPDKDSRKQYDVIIAPYELWHREVTADRRLFVLKLWQLLNPIGGILILLEKGVPRGFEVLADARKFMIDELFAKDGASGTPILEDSQVKAKDIKTDHVVDSESNPTISNANASNSQSGSQTGTDHSLPQAIKGVQTPAHIVAPCPHENGCPLYVVPGISRQRKDYCRFQQRVHRPPFLQRLLNKASRSPENAKKISHDDVPYSYVIVQKGLTFKQRQAHALRPNELDQVLSGKEATIRAHAGYSMAELPSSGTIPSPLPRIILEPMKRTGHVLLDVCTPSGQFDRWTVPRSFGKGAYRDARKASWGDLWALGAKHRASRQVRLGTKDSGTKHRPQDDDDADTFRPSKEEKSKARLVRQVKLNHVARGAARARRGTPRVNREVREHLSADATA